MTVRPPTLREKRRYVLARIDPAGAVVDSKDLYYAVSDAVTSLWGDTTAAIVQAAVVTMEGGHVVVRCHRGSERELIIALSTVTMCRDTRIALRIRAVSGTIDGLRRRLKPMEHQIHGQEEPEEVLFGGKKFIPLECEGGKVDVIEKGFKNTNRLFLTSEDMEVS